MAWCLGKHTAWTFLSSLCLLNILAKHQCHVSAHKYLEIKVRAMNVSNASMHRTVTSVIAENKAINSPAVAAALLKHLLTSLQGSPARGNDGVSAVQFLPRWHPEENPLYHRRLGARWHDMCAESLGMPKVALCFLTRGPVHQVRPRSPTAFSWPEVFLCAFFLKHAPGRLS